MNKLGLPKFGWIHNPTELTHVDVEENAESNTLFHNSKQEFKIMSMYGQLFFQENCLIEVDNSKVDDKHDQRTVYILYNISGVQQRKRWVF